MPNSSILGGDRADRRAAGRDTDSLGPSDSSDSGSDIQGEQPMRTAPDQADELGAVPVNAEADSDRAGTGERASAAGTVVDGADIMPDRIAGDPALPDRGLGDNAERPDALDPDELTADANARGPDDDIDEDAQNELGQVDKRRPPAR